MTGGGGTSSVAFVIERMNFMRTLSIDIESFSSVNLQKSGVYKYASSDDFEILLFGYYVDGGDVQVVDLALGEEIPQEILDALKDDEVIKWAFNASFERICLSAFLPCNFQKVFCRYKRVHIRVLFLRCQHSLKIRHLIFSLVYI